MHKPVIFREYDIRGVVGEQFDDHFAYELGKAHITFIYKNLGVKNPKVTVGYDARLSSPSLAKSMVKGMIECGAHVYELGLITTPISYFSTFSIEGVVGGIMITGSHNPPEYNGFKISVGKTTIYGSNIKELQKIIDSQDFVKSVSGKSEKFDIFPSYLKKNKDDFGKLKPVKVVIDCGNGAAGCIARRLFTEVGIDCTILFEKPDGTFPNHHPDPTVEENMEDLKRAVLSEGALLGIGFDGDADRIGVIDHNGRMLLGDELMTIISRDLLQNQKGLTIIGDVKCSDRMYDDIRKNGGNAIMWKTGHSLIKTKIKEEKAPFGGELSGHIFFADRNYGYDDAMYAGLRLIEIIGKTQKNIDQLLSGFPPAHNTPEIRIDTTEEKKVAIVEALKKTYPKDTDRYRVNFTDGIRISYKDGWALARASNTQPVLVLRFESTSESGLTNIRKELESLINPLL